MRFKFSVGLMFHLCSIMKLFLDWSRRTNKTFYLAQLPNATDCMLPLITYMNSSDEEVLPKLQAWHSITEKYFERSRLGHDYQAAGPFQHSLPDFLQQTPPAKRPAEKATAEHSQEKSRWRRRTDRTDTDTQTREGGGGSSSRR